MYYDLVITNGTLVYSDTMRKANVCITNGKIVDVIDHTDFEAAATYDASNLHVLPGLIDLHVHSRDGKNSRRKKEDIAHSTMAAACGGITTIAEMPNCFPAACSLQAFKDLQSCFEGNAYTDYGIWAMTLGKHNVSELDKMICAGALGLKLFWGYALDKEQYTLVYNYRPDMKNVLAPPSSADLYESFCKAAKLKKCVYIHAENFNLINENQKKMDASRFPNPYEAALAIRTEESERSIVAEAIALAKKSGCHIHIAHVSAGKTVEMIRKARNEGVVVTAETAPHYLTLTNEDYEQLGAGMKVYPLIRTSKDQQELWNGILDGTISILASDHAPHMLCEKETDFEEAAAGMPGVETTCCVMLDQVNKGKIHLTDFVRIFSEEPAKHLHLFPEKGSLQPGADADITIIDMKKKVLIDKNKLHYLVKASPYLGRTFTGAPVATILRGNVIMENGSIVGLPKGHFVRAR